MFSKINSIITFILSLVIYWGAWMLQTAIFISMNQAWLGRPSGGVTAGGALFALFSSYRFVKWVRKKFFNSSITIIKRNEAIGYLKQGNTEYKNGKFKEAIKYYTKAIEIDSNFKEAINNRNKARKKLGNISLNYIDIIESNFNNLFKKLKWWKKIILGLILQIIILIPLLDFELELTLNNIFNIIESQITIILSWMLVFIFFQLRMAIWFLFLVYSDKFGDFISEKLFNEKKIN